MNNSVNWVIGFGMLLLAGNAAAIMISGTSGAGPVDVDISLQEISELLKSYQPDTRTEKKALKKAKKFSSKINKLQTKLDGHPSDKKIAKLERKIGEKEKRLAAFLRQMNLDLSNSLTSGIKPAVTDIGNIQGEFTLGNQPGNDTSNVPEPSALALLAIGTIGVGAT